jgi:hypothetical protein
MSLALTAVACLSAKAGLRVPYALDPDTLHLWHFDDARAYVNNVNTITDAAPGGILLTNIGLGGPPYTNIFLVTNDAAAVLSDSLSILPGDGGAAAAPSHGMAAGPADMDPTAFANPTTGAFTFEAIVNAQGNIFNSAAGSGEWEIFCGDNSVGTRGWQFRLQNQAVPVVDFNFITASGGSSVNQTFNLPTTGADALATNQWYHVAVTFTGYAPTNNDPAGVMTFYWTLLDKNRTNADVLGAITNSGLGTIGGTPSPAIGGSQRTVHGVGNGGSFQGFIDEVRVSDIARQPNDMVFTTNATINPPTFAGGSEPPASTFLGYGRPLNVNAVVLGTLPITYQWQVSATGASGWSNVAGQTNNTLSLPAVTFADAGFYQLVATNEALNNNSVTSSVAQVIVGAVPSELFNTGINTNGVLDTTLAGNPDPHYVVLQSADPINLGPNAIVWDMTTYPIAANGGGFANIDGVSQWIGTQSGSYTSVDGEYIYRTHFLLDTVDTTRPIIINGTWWDNSVGNDILLNGQSTGNAGAAHNGTGSVAFTITNGFKPGLNTLDFVVTKDGNTGGGSYQESAVRVEIHGLGYALAPGLPVITNQPADQTVADGAYYPGSVATFSVVALGRPPLTYQWWADGSPILGATNRTLVFNSPSAFASPGTNFTVFVTDAAGTLQSRTAVLTLVASNQPPVVPNYSLVIYSNTTATFNLDTAYMAAADADNDPLALGSPAFDSSSTNGGTISQNGVILTYTPVPDYVGQDEFNYYVSDSQGATTAGAVNVTMVPLVVPSAFSAVKSGGNVLLSASGASAGGAFHILQATDLTTPLTNWVTVVSSNFDNSGGISIPIPITAGVPQSFYMISVP